ncbi:MAG: hypothetical protein LIO65_06700 [Odoribacter sp.]|nr:hypothetical protein [Odoribacter sp.]
MTGTLRYISWIIGMILILNTSCNNDKVYPEGGENGGDGEGEVEFYLFSLQTYATDPGSASEQTIKEVDILVFKNDQYQYHREANKRVSTYHTTLKIDDGLTLYFLINARSLLQNNTELVEGKSWENDIRPSLILQNPTSLLASDSLPMWAIRENVDIIGGKINQLSDIHILRAVASVDIYNNSDTSAFKLKEAYLYFVPNKGYIAPSSANYDPAEKGVTAVESLADIQILTTPLMTDKVDNEKILYQLYAYENDAAVPTTAQKRFTRLVVGGSFEGGPTTYYPVDFLDDNLTDVLQLTRNFKYIISINSVSSPGHPDPGTASEEYDTRLIVDIIEWNLIEEKEIVFDGPYYISTETKWVYLYQPAGSTVEKSFSTNLKLEDLTMEFIDSGKGTQQNGTNLIRNDRFEVEFILDGENNIKAIKYTALQDYDRQNPDNNIQVLKIHHNRIEMEITIEQLDESPTHWIDGGNTGVEIGGDD